MRDKETIEREIFAARVSLEDSIGDLVHVLREKTAVRARATHAAGKRPVLLAVVALALVGIWWLRRRRARVHL